MGTVTAIRTATGTPDGATAIAAWAAHLPTVRGRSGYLTTPNTIKAYLSAAAAVVDPAAPVAELDTEPGAAALRTAVTGRWGSAAPATFNAKRAAIAAFTGFCRDRGWITTDPLAGLTRTPQPKPVPRARPRAEIDRLLRDTRHPLRDRVLWALLYETTARAEEILALDVEDLDLRNSRAGVVRKGSAPDIVTWDRGGLAARLLARYLGTRTRGPLFLTIRAAKGSAKGTVRPADLDPDTGRGRYGYDAALKALKNATGGWTPHDLRHSGLTHNAEDGQDVTHLMVKSGHQDIRSVARYARPSADAAQRTAEEARARHAGRAR